MAAGTWYANLPWLVGCNYIPSCAVNQLEMWQRDSFESSMETNRRELGWASEAGLNMVRVFLHNLLYDHDPEGLLARIDTFLTLCDERGIRVMFVLFDDCWHAGAKIGAQPAPVPGIHNSRWLQSPGLQAAQDPASQDKLEHYVKGVISSFGHDRRVLLWDIYNENGNFFLPLLPLPAYQKWPQLIPRFLKFRFSMPATFPLLKKAFSWARACRPDQPLTAASWIPHPALNRQLYELSDVISFHNYEKPAILERQIKELQSHGRPLLCTEYMARTRQSNFATALPLFKRHNVAACHWGLVNGKTQTIYSWINNTAGEPEVWYHDILHTDGRPYDQNEIDLLKALILK
jgi:hypothetical protein